MASYRKEKDSMGEMQVPRWALYGASTQRAVENFPISGRPVPAEVIHAFGHLKAACAQANFELKKLNGVKTKAIIRSASAVAKGALDEHFPVDVFQTGSGTSTNMNANEVIANHASQLKGKPIGSRDPLHPNDHVNMGQSSNDTFPTAMHIAAAVGLQQQLRPALVEMKKELKRKARQWDRITKIGRTHLMDATPIRVGQVFSGYASQMEHGITRIDHAIAQLSELAIGGTAVGTGINTHPRFSKKVCRELSRRTGVKFREADNHPEAQAAKDAYVDASGALKTLAVSLSKIANDIRWLGSGPRCGLGELQLPATQPGSSIMPGKVNPVMCESIIQIAARVIGNDTVITYGGFGGVGSILELNVAMPLMADAMMENIRILSNGMQAFLDKLLYDLEVDKDRATGLIEQSLMMVTSLAPVIGYDTASALAKRALKEGKTIRELVTEEKLLDPAELNMLLNARRMTEPH